MQNNRVLALGFFDGVHLGHAALLQTAVRRAHERRAIAAAISFDTHPDTLVYGRSVPLLNSMAEREALMRERCGVEEVVFVHFDRAMMDMPWETFVAVYLLHTLHACHLVCGRDFRFGRRGEGSAEKLLALCRELGVGCDIIGEVCMDGGVVSSTRIRALLQKGECAQAVRLLGHGQLLSGEVRHGAHRGTGLGFPTANLAFSPGILVPAFGVYCAQAELDGKRLPALVNIGVHPTLGALPQPVLEAHLPGFSGNLYGKTLRIWLLTHLRGEMRFDSPAALRQQLQHDLAACMDFLGAAPGPMTP